MVSQALGGTAPPEALASGTACSGRENDKKQGFVGCVIDLLEDSSLSCTMPPGTPNPPTLAPLRPSYVGVARVDGI